MLFDGKEIPPWAIRLFVLVLILPVLLAAVDGLARANRRGYSITRSALSVLAASVPFALAVLAVLGAKLTGLLAIAPPDPVGPGTVPIHGGDVALIIGLGCLIVGAFALGRWLLPYGKRAGEAGVQEAVFDRGGYQYHGRVRALAEGAREGGLRF